MSDGGKFTSELRELYENAPCGYHSVDARGTIVRMNRTELGWLGFLRDELVGRRKFRDAVSARSSPRYERAFDSLREGAGHSELEARLVRKDGSGFDAFLRIDAMRDERRAFLGTRATVLDISARKRAQDEARRYAVRLRAMSRRLVAVQENEQRRLSAELHDRIGQDLAIASLNLHILKDLLPVQRQARIGSLLDDSIHRIESTVDAVRDVAGVLRPPVLDEYGLVAALRAHAEQFAARTGIRVRVDSTHAATRLPADVEMALFRVSQEALANVCRHAAAHNVSVTLESGASGARLAVADDGRGFDAGGRGLRDGEGLGLLIMRERLLAVNGSLRVESVAGAGTRIVARVAAAP